MVLGGVKYDEIKKILNLKRGNSSVFPVTKLPLYMKKFEFLEQID